MKDENVVDHICIGFASAMDTLISLLASKRELKEKDITEDSINKAIKLIAFSMIADYGAFRLRDRIDSYFGGMLTLKKNKLLYDDIKKLFGIVIGD